MFRRLKFHLILTVVISVSLALLVSCGGAEATHRGADQRAGSPSDAGARSWRTSTAAGYRSPGSRPRPKRRRGLSPGLPRRRAPPGQVGPTATPLAVAEPTGETVYSDAAKLLMTGGAKALAEANGESPRYGGILLANNWEPIPFYDMHQTSFGGVYVITAPAYNGLLASSPYDPLALEIIPDLAQTWELSDGGATVTFHLAEGVVWHDGEPFSSEDVKWTIDRIKDPPEGMVSPRRGVFSGTLSTVETPDPNTVVIKADGASPLLVPLFSNGWNAIIPKHISEVDPVNALMTQVVGTGAFRLVEPPTTTLWRYERNPDYWEDDLPYVDEIEYQIIQDAQSQAAALLTKKIYFNDAIFGVNFSPELAQSVADREPGLIYSPIATIAVSHFVVNTERAPFDDIRVRQALSEAVRRESFDELSPQGGTPGTGNFPLGPWALPKEIQETLPGYGPDMDVRIENAMALLAEYESEHGEIDWDSMTIQCSSNLTGPAPTGRWRNSTCARSASRLHWNPWTSRPTGATRYPATTSCPPWPPAWTSTTPMTPSASGTSPTADAGTSGTRSRRLTTCSTSRSRSRTSRSAASWSGKWTR